jgi:putative transport protein
LAPIPFAILILALVAVLGLLVGGIRVRGIGLGSAGVLFAGILFGHFGASIDENIAEFAKEFGLVLFVFTIGLQLGPGIIQLWRQQGLLLNGLAALIVALGLVLVLIFRHLLDLSVFASAGIFSGSTTNTPSLGAAQQAAATLESSSGEEIGLLASAYAVSYPGGIVGIIAAMLILRLVFRINVADEASKLRSAASADRPPIQRYSVQVDNSHLAGLPFGEIPGVEETGVRISRIRRAGEDLVRVATDETTLHPGDLILVVGAENELARFVPLLGTPTDVDLTKSIGDVQFRRVVVTDPGVLNTPLRELSLDHLYNVTITRIRRAGVEMTARGSSRFYYGDVAHVVGDEESLTRVSKLLGNSVKKLSETDFAPIFLGIAAGVLLGMVPLPIPGVPFPVKLGLAGGPLVAAICLSLIGSVGRVVWYIPTSTNLALREFGIILFLACAGLSAGETFFSTAMTSEGGTWMLVGLAVTMVPLLVSGCIARIFGKMNYLTICGLVAGSMTDPPALAFANSNSDSDACSTAYAAVYPLTMILRIVAAQAVVYALA